MPLTLKQACVLDSNRNWVAATGAGAGKTLSLTERFIHLLDENPALRINEILALTFTQKAASEMQSRIYQAINRIVHDETLARAKRERFRIVKEEFAQNSISTFHAFCLGFLKTHPVEGEIDPRTTVLTEFEHKQLLREAYQDVLQGFIRRPKDGTYSEENRQFLSLLECWELRQLRDKVFDLLLQSDRYELFAKTFYRAAKSEEKFLDEILERGAAQVLAKLKDETFLANLGKTLEVLQSTPAADTAFLEMVREVALLIERLRGPKDLIEVAEPILALLEHEAVRSRARVAKAPLTALQMADHLAKAGLAVLDREHERLSLHYLGLLITFVNEVKSRYETLCQENRVVDFGALQRKMRRLFEAHPTVLSEVRERFRFIIVDEFQDTDALQWEIIRRLATDEADALHPNRVLIVGDEKQAIYGFRGGDVRIFRVAAEALLQANPKDKPLYFENGGEEFRRYREEFLQFAKDDPAAADRVRNGFLEFPENFRSSEVPIAFFNEFFARLFDPANGFDPPPQPMLAVPAPGKVTGRVDFLAVPRQEKSEGGGEREKAVVAEEGRRAEAEMVARYVKNLLNAPASRAMEHALEQGEPAVAVLFRRFTEVKVYEEAFRRFGIDFFVHRGRGFYERQEILDLYNILEFLHDTRKEIHLIGILRSPVFGLKDAEILELSQGRKEAMLFWSLAHVENPRLREFHALLKTWQQLKDRLRLSELIRHIIADTGWNAVLAMGARGKQRLYNVEKFIEIARGFEANGVRGLADFCQYVREQIQREEHEGEARMDTSVGSPVVFMTIHQSKGLEFPIVLLPDLNARFRSMHGDLLEILDEPDGYFYGIDCPNPRRGFVREPTVAKMVLRERARKRALAEEKRLFYVGCTRAIEQLVLAGLAREKDEDELPRPIDEASCIWDWFENLLGLYQGITQVQISPAGGIYEVRWPKSFARPPENSSAPEIPALLDDKTPTPKTSFQMALAPLEVEGLFKLSPTSLVLYELCRRKFYFRDILKIPENILLRPTDEREEGEEGLSEAEGEKRKEEARLCGVLVHRLLEDPGRLAETNLPERIKWVLDRELEDLSQPLRGEVISEDIIKEVILHVNAFAKDPLAAVLTRLYEEDPARIMAEVPFELDLGGVRLRGAIDKVFQREAGGRWTILDFKTDRLRGRVGKSEESLRTFVEKHHYDLQLNCYALAAEEILGKGKLEKLLLFFTEDDRGLLEVPLDLERARRLLEDVAGIVRREDFASLLEAKPARDSLCFACGFRSSGLCDYPRKK